MSDVYDIWLYPLHDWWKMVNEMLDGKFHFLPSVCAMFLVDRVQRAPMLHVLKKLIELAQA